MKKNFGLFLAMLVAGTSWAADPASPPATTPPTTTPPPAATPTTPPIADPGPVTNSVVTTNKPAKKTAKKSTTAKKKASKPADVPLASPLVLNEPAASVGNKVNIRAQSHINSEVITQLKTGDTVMVLDEVVLKNPKTDEPARWARVSLPPGTSVWVNSGFIDTTNQTVTAKKLNVRSGPGQNFSVIGILQKGDAVKTEETKGDWTKIAAPTNAFGFVAAHMLKHIEPAAIPTSTQVASQQPIATNPTEPEKPAPTPAEPEKPATPTATTPVPAPAPEPIPVEPPKRVVTREGVVGGTVSVQAPTYFELFSLDNGKPIDYLYTTSTNLILKKYKGRTILVSGEEELDERWPNTPVLTIQRIQVVQ